MQIESPFQIFQIKKVCETVIPIGNELSLMYKGEVQVFSDSVLYLDKSTMNTPETKFFEKWKKHLENFKDRGES